MTAKAKAAAPSAAWKPVPVAVQVKRHQAALVKAAQAAALAAVLPAHVKKAKRVAARKATRVAARQAKHAKKPGAPLIAEDVACCVAEALAMSLRLAGWQVTDQEVLDLYWLTADDPDEGATVPDTLAAFQAAGYQGAGEALILGLDLPAGPHAVLATPDGWWSWGLLFEPPDLPVSEAWAVTW